MHCTERRTTPIPAPLRHDWEHGETGLYGGQLHSHPLLISVLCAIGSFSPERLLSQARHDSTAPILHAQSNLSPFSVSLHLSLWLSDRTTRGFSTRGFIKSPFVESQAFDLKSPRGLSPLPIPGGTTKPPTTQAGAESAMVVVDRKGAAAAWYGKAQKIEKKPAARKKGSSGGGSGSGGGGGGGNGAKKQGMGAVTRPLSEWFKNTENFYGKPPAQPYRQMLLGIAKRKDEEDEDEEGENDCAIRGHGSLAGAGGGEGEEPRRCGEGGCAPTADDVILCDSDCDGGEESKDGMMMTGEPTQTSPKPWPSPPLRPSSVAHATASSAASSSSRTAPRGGVSKGSLLGADGSSKKAGTSGGGGQGSNVRAGL